MPYYDMIPDFQNRHAPFVRIGKHRDMISEQCLQTRDGIEDHHNIDVSPCLDKFLECISYTDIRYIIIPAAVILTKVSTGYGNTVEHSDTPLVIPECLHILNDVFPCGCGYQYAQCLIWIT